MPCLGRGGGGYEGYQKRTLFNAVLLDLAVALLLLDALDAVVKVVLGGGALLGVLALCKSR